ncbi:hypothetical protein G6F56_010704 [Rhizopus delemar]|nr:hypothetical protein G6F56_010704 [Rhizopus delemar]
MNSGQLRTWPTISMISNRMRIEATVETGRRALKEYHDTSDVGSEDELMFLSGRRASMPTTNVEQNRRRQFMAQFNDSEALKGAQGVRIGEMNPLEYSHEQ